MIKKILVTGAAGYIGSVLTRQLLKKGYSVRGLDNLKFGGDSLLEVFNHPKFEFQKGDIRNFQDIKKAIDGSKIIIHLAAIVGDPACVKEPDLARQTNWLASKRLFDLANQSKNIKRFIFASTCSNYGQMAGQGYVNENSLLKPISLYAKLKVKFEKYLLESHVRSDFVPISLRFATVYGFSPRMRFDLTVNEFAKVVALGRKLTIFGEQFWRPYCYVEDIAQACVLVFEADKIKVKNQVFGVGDTKENYQKKMIAAEILKFVPKAKIKYVTKNEDPRDYKVDFSKIKKTLKFRIKKTLPLGLREIHNIVTSGLIENPDSARYKNI